MDFSLLFDKLSINADWLQELEQDAVFHSIFAYQDDFPELEELDIVIFSIDDNRGTDNHVLDATEVRKSFYQLKKSSAHYKIADIGCLRPGPTYEDTISRAKEVLSYFFDQGIFPIILNASQDLVYHCYTSLIEVNEKEKLNIAVIDRLLDVNASGNADDSFINQILEHAPNKLHRFKLLGYQGYLVNPNIKSVFDKLAFEEIRLGQLQTNILNGEPFLRNSNIVSFDLGALKSTDFPANGINTPFGLTSAEACQLTWFTGLSEACKCFIFSGYRQEEDKENLSANGLSVILWHLIEGFYSRQTESLENDTTTYIIENESLGEEITFLKGNLTGKWWILIDNEYLPCTITDYQQTNQGLLPDIWMREVMKG